MYLSVLLNLCMPFLIDYVMPLLINQKSVFGLTCLTITMTQIYVIKNANLMSCHIWHLSVVLLAYFDVGQELVILGVSFFSISVYECLLQKGAIYVNMVVVMDTVTMCIVYVYYFVTSCFDLRERADNKFRNGCRCYYGLLLLIYKDIDAPHIP